MADTSHIRNISQSHQERTIIKQAPDMVVYLEGLPYLLNPWGPDGVAVVPLNDFVTSISGAADVGTFIPGATINLSVPNHQKTLFQGPGGNCPLRTMMEVKIFTRGYYLTNEGETVYHRIFWGVIDNVNLVENETTLQITLACKGILHLFDLMQFNLAPSAQTAGNTGSKVVAYTDNLHAHTPIQAILQMFLAPLGDKMGKVNVVDKNTVVAQDNLGLGHNEESVGKIMTAMYVTKWTEHLLNIRKGLRLFGLSKDPIDCDPGISATESKLFASMDTRSEGGALRQNKTEAASLDDYNFALVSEYLPSYAISSIQLIQSSIASRLDKVKEMTTEAMGWEGYQDVDGSIVIKPPLYNLNPLNTRDTPLDRNPFVINLDERLGGDTFMEDESQVRLTRVAVKGRMTDSDSIAVSEGGHNLLPVGVYADPILIKQFGLRHEGVKQIQYLGRHTNMLYAFAAAELTSTIKRWKTYTVTIPLRPEIRLGFPIHITWRDFMAYLDNVSWNYTRGSSATMTLSTVMVRTRELFPGQTEIQGVPTTVFAPIRNAILRWTTPGPITPAQAKNPLSPINSPATLPMPAKVDMSPEQKRLRDQMGRTAQVAGNPPDLPGYAWRIQEDTGAAGAAVPDAQVFLSMGVNVTDFNARFATSFYKEPRSVDAYYFMAVQNYAIPYTDADGYVLARPFPWGRFTKLEDALDIFTRSSKHRTGAVLPFESRATGAAATEKGTSQAGNEAASVLKDPAAAFMLTGLGTPTSESIQGTNTVVERLSDLMQLVGDDTTCFTVKHITTGDTTGSGLAPNPNGPAVGESNTIRQQAQAVQGNSGMHPDDIPAFAGEMVSGPALDLTDFKKGKVSL